MLSVRYLSLYPVCRSVVSVTLVNCRHTVGRIKMKLGTQSGLGVVLDEDIAPPPQRGTAPQLPAHVCCDQVAACTKMPLGMEVGLGQGDFALDGPRSAPQKGAEPPHP